MNSTEHNQNVDGQRYAAAIGMFDGVHAGHRHLLECVKQQASARGLAPAVITFSQHPSQIITPKAPVLRLTSNERRKALINRSGIDHVIVLDFTQQLRGLTARQFMEMIHNEHNVDCLVVGFNNHFGSDRSLGFNDYRAIGKELGIDVVQATELPERRASSSMIRRLLGRGNVEEAAACLGRNFSLEGTVVAGNQLGRTIGFPTANVKPALAGSVVPAPGVYAALITIEGVNGKHGAMVNIGHRPTVNTNPDDVTIEAHIFGLD
ncbi:MAG: riboflavin biosynthesis protein RibF, partial [Bacteroides sp.]|nr:riboflavin biosynthesis protein RibF [Bacteroides sp.]